MKYTSKWFSFYFCDFHERPQKQMKNWKCDIEKNAENTCKKGVKPVKFPEEFANLASVMGRDIKWPNKITKHLPTEEKLVMKNWAEGGIVRKQPEFLFTQPEMSRKFTENLVVWHFFFFFDEETRNCTHNTSANWRISGVSDKNTMGNPRRWGGAETLAESLAKVSFLRFDFPMEISQDGGGFLSISLLTALNCILIANTGWFWVFSTHYFTKYFSRKIPSFFSHSHWQFTDKTIFHGVKFVRMYTVKNSENSS